jgi:hypothetical protein
VRGEAAAAAVRFHVGFHWGRVSLYSCAAGHLHGEDHEDGGVLCPPFVRRGCPPFVRRGAVPVKTGRHLLTDTTIKSTRRGTAAVALFRSFWFDALCCALHAAQGFSLVHSPHCSWYALWLPAGVSTNLCVYDCPPGPVLVRSVPPPGVTTASLKLLLGRFFEAIRAILNVACGLGGVMMASTERPVQ